MVYRRIKSIVKAVRLIINDFYFKLNKKLNLFLSVQAAKEIILLPQIQAESLIIKAQKQLEIIKKFLLSVLMILRVPKIFYLTVGNLFSRLT